MERRARGATAILVVCWAWLVCAAEGSYTLAIWVQGYQNPSHQALELQAFRHGCCERDTALPCDPCDNAFKFCVREGTTGMVLGGCDIAELQTARVAEDDDDLMFSLGDDIGGVTNPLMVTGDMWPGTIEILFTVYDLDGTVNIDYSSSDVVDNLLISPDITAVADDSFSDSMSYSGNFSQVQLAFRLTCGPAHYGTDCSVYCVETNDTTGHFTCDPATGDRLCLEGYSDPLTNCTRGPNPCDTYNCSTGYECQVYEPTVEAYCEPTCEPNPCDPQELCQITTVICITSPCPGILFCEFIEHPITSTRPSQTPCPSPSEDASSSSGGPFIIVAVVVLTAAAAAAAAAVTVVISVSVCLWKRKNKRTNATGNVTCGNDQEMMKISEVYAEISDPSITTSTNDAYAISHRTDGVTTSQNAAYGVIADQSSGINVTTSQNAAYGVIADQSSGSGVRMNVNEAYSSVNEK